MIILIFFVIGLIFGSFSTVLIERWHSGKGGIIMGRSECPHCQHILGTGDLFPLFSYLVHRGRCRHCGIKISLFYPIAELIMGMIFAVLAFSAIQLNIDIMSREMFLLLIFGFITGVYMLYDIKYMEIPDQVMVPAIYLILIIPFISLLFVGSSEYTFHTFHISIYDRLFGALILYTFLYIQILIPGGYFLIKNKKWKLLVELFYSYVTFPFFLLLDFWKTRKGEKQENNEMEIPTWIGGGDLRIALFIGLTLGTLHGIASFAFAYIIGSIVGICILLYHLSQGRKAKSQIPFGPFLGIGWILSIVFYKEIVICYTLFFIGQ